MNNQIGLHVVWYYARKYGYKSPEHVNALIEYGYKPFNGKPEKY